MEIIPISFYSIEIYLYMFELALIVEESTAYCTGNVLEMCEMQAKL